MGWGAAVTGATAGWGAGIIAAFVRNPEVWAGVEVPEVDPPALPTHQVQPPDDVMVLAPAG